MASFYHKCYRFGMPSRLIVEPSHLKGEILIPGSKSQTLRALLFGALAGGETRIDHPLFSNDSEAMVQACRKFGAQVVQGSDFYSVRGVCGDVSGASGTIDAGNSGIVLRFCSAVGALASSPVHITGDHSICNQRPMSPLIDALRQSQVEVECLGKDGYAPLMIKGPLQRSQVCFSGKDSQPVSALLIAGAFSKEGISFSVDNPGEKPWVQLTLNWLDRLGISYQAKDFTHYQVTGGNRISGFHYTVPGDLSTLAFPVVQAILSGTELAIGNVDLEDGQGDKELFSLFTKMGADFKYDKEKKTLHVRKSMQLKGVSVDINGFIDALPILAVAACFAEGETRILNASVAREKECNRIAAVSMELRKMGARIQETVDGLKIQGAQLKGAHLHSHHDHRMAMALTVAAMNAEGVSEIESVECIGKTYPSFAFDWKKAGARLEIVE
ncbi:MAG: 3-phosphoshikimate 1-carboxyvinyltransferase [Parachlamydiaceae bacterium]